MKRLFTLLFLMISAAEFASAKVTLPSVFSNGMVLQQQSDVAIWGKSTVGATVQIVTSWDAKTYTVNVAPDGSWKTKVITPIAGGPYSITVSDTELLTLCDVLIGEVWLASGQSNMEMVLSGISESQPVLNSPQAIQNSENPNIRLFKSAKLSWAQPAENLTGQWQAASPSTVGGWSAIAYFYAKNLYEKLNVPVGILQVAYGGTTIQAWMSAESLQPFPEVILPAVSNSALADKTTPTGLFNAMINPMLGYGIKGVIWYQGEQNRGEPELYAKLFPIMINDWRQRWGIGDFPFHYVQIAPYGSPVSYVPFIPFLREAQLKTLDKTPNTAMAVILDKGSPTTNHPPDKEIVAERLTAIAFAKTYGFTNQKFSGPVYKSITIQGNKAVLSFDNADSGLKFTSGESLNFEIAGSNKVFYPGNAIINNNTIEVSSASVTNPVAVRYAFKAWVVGDLFNQDGFPASSFRTDDWVDSQPSPSVSNSIAGWEFSAYYNESNRIEGPIEATLKNENLALATLSRGNASNFKDLNYAYSVSTKSKSPNNSKQEALENKDYFLVDIKPSVGYNISLTKLNYKLRRNELNGPVSYVWSFKRKGMSDFVEIGDADTLQYASLGIQKAPLDLSDIPELQEVSYADSLVFRLLFWNAGTGSNTDIAIGRNTSGTDKGLVLSFEGNVSKTLLAGWEFSEHGNGNNVIAGAKEAIVKDASIAVASLSRGDESSRNELNFAYSFKAKSIAPNNNKADALSNKDYFLVKLKASEGYSLALKKLNYKLRRDNNNGPQKFIWSYKRAGMQDFVEIGEEQTLPFDTYGVQFDPINLSAIPSLQNISSTDSVIFRLLVWQSGSTGSANIAIGRVSNGSDRSLVLSFEGESLGTLPVELINFTARNNQGSVTLKWQTLSERNNAKFEVLRSQDGVDFVTIGNKTGKGNSSSIESYAFTDYTPLPGTAYYKLKQVDFNGDYKFYDAIAVKNTALLSELDVYVFNNQLVVTSTEDSQKVVEISIVDLSGRKFFNKSLTLTRGYNRYETSVSFLSPGLYVANVKTLKGNKIFKFIK